MIENVKNKDILSFEVEKSNINENRVVGSFQKNSTTIELLNPSNKYSNLKGTYITTIRGTFYVNEIEPTQEKIKIKLSCYDLSHKFDEECDKNKFIFPMTLKEWKKRICDILNIECDNRDFPNSNKVVQTLPYIKDKATYRDVIEMIAQAGLCWAIIDYDDILKFEWFDNNINNEIEDWFELTTEDEECDPVNVVVLGRGVVEDNVVYPEIEPLNPKEIRIDSNEILDSDRKGMIIPLYEQANGFSYTIFSMKTSGRLDAKVGQKITYLDIDRKQHCSFIMKHTLIFAGGDYTKEYNWISKFEAVELDETNTNYKYAESIEEKTNRTERLANKLNGIIVDVVEEVDGQGNRISSVEQKADSIESTVKNDIYTKSQVDTFIQNSETGITNTFSEAGGNNIFKNTGLWYEEESQTNNSYEFWDGVVSRKTNENAANYVSLLLQKGMLLQTQEVPNGNYTVSFKYKKLIELANVKVVINGMEYQLDSLSDKEFQTGTRDPDGAYIIQPLMVSTRHIEVAFITDINNSCEIWDLMVNAGTVKLAYSQNQNETTTDTVNISKGITIEASATNVKFKANSDGIRVVNKNTGETRTDLTDEGITTDEIIVKNKATMCKTLVQDTGDQTWLTRL